MENHGKPMENPWKTMENPWKTMENHGLFNLENMVDLVYQNIFYKYKSI